MDASIFKAYDIRGTYPDQINETAVERIAGAYAAHLQLEGKTVAVGRDVRVSSPSLQAAVIKGLTAAGVNVIDIGLGPTELIYFAVGSLNLAGGIQVSASHNPAEYNGLKMVKAGVEAISSDTGLEEIKSLVQGDQVFGSARPGTVTEKNLTEDYLAAVTKLVNLVDLPPLRIVANNNFGLSGPLAKQAITALKVPVELIELNFQPDGTFPKGRPDPLIAENRAETSAAVTQHKANLAVAWDADGDRCYVADQHGQFVEGCHLTALLAEHLLKKNPPAGGPGQKIIYDPRNIWATEETVAKAGGQAVLNKAGHTFIKNRMKAEAALFAGEMSGHFYYRDFYNADNGLLTFLYVLEILSQSQKTLAELVEPLRAAYHVSGEINFKVSDVKAAVADVQERFPGGKEDLTDGLSVTFDNWRFNLRSSNTEPLLRLNVEARDADTLMTATNRLTEVLRYHTATH